ncbi:MAG: hypothetical protein IT546_11440 [Caulobacteraceae bacterium]|nr:hypothetical protein [Caulobacteraceae bacterium]
MLHDLLAGMTNRDWINIAAVVVGPLAAVLITRWLDMRRERDDRRMEVFKTLMRTRRTPIAADNVGALNLIELEFYNDKPIIDAWRNLFQHFGGQHARRPEEQLNDHMSDD